MSEVKEPRLRNPARRWSATPTVAFLRASVPLLLAIGCSTGARPPDAPATHPLVGGGEVEITRSSDVIRVKIHGPGPGLASVCVGDDSRVEILHASAALGTALYEREGSSWHLKGGFDFVLREAAGADARRGQFERYGWLANPSRRGTPLRELEIRASPRRRFLGVTFLGTEGTPRASYWPPSMDEGCRDIRLLQGYLEPQARFRPETWAPLEGRSSPARQP